MKKIVPIMALLGVSLSAVADDSAISVMNDWRHCNTNAYRIVMERRLDADRADIAGLLMKYFWDRVFEFGATGGTDRYTNTIARLVAAARTYQGPRFAASRDFFIASLEEDRDWSVTHVFTERENQAYRATISNWKCYALMNMYAEVFKALEDDGAFRSPPTLWTSDPSLYRVEESDTNLYECVTELWRIGALTNVSRIASRRLARNANDLPGRLLAFDCSWQCRDVSSALGHLSALEHELNASTNAAIMAARETFADDAACVRGSSADSDASAIQALPFNLMPGMLYPHRKLLLALIGGGD